MARVLAARIAPPPHVLRQLSQHVTYEVEMALGSASRLLQTETALLDRRAHAESFVLHARQLERFFYRRPPRQIDVSAPAPGLFAVDYVPDWAAQRPPVLETLARDIGKRVTYLTLDRIIGQEYPVRDAARALLVVIRAFRDARPPDFTADLGALAPPWDRKGSVTSTNEPVFIRIAEKVSR